VRAITIPPGVAGLGLVLCGACALAAPSGDAGPAGALASALPGGGFTAAAGPGAGGTLAGTFRYHRVHSAFLPDDRTVIVYLPRSYATSPERRYPVIYGHDGNNLFDAATAFMGREWRLDETLEALTAQGRVPEAIAVGVYNTSARLFEYTWVPDAERRGGGGERHGRLLAEELKPFVDRTYRTLPDRDSTTVLGSSLGGLASFYLGRHRGDSFGRIGMLSPSIWWADRAILADVPALRKDLRLWLDMGTAEGTAPADNVANARRLRDALAEAGYTVGQNLGYLEDPGAAHDEGAWARRAPRVLEFLLAESAR